MANALASTVTRSMPQDNQVRTGTVLSSSGAGVMVQVGGVAQGPFRRLSSYAPANGDTVALMRAASSWLVLGKIV